MRSPDHDRPERRVPHLVVVGHRQPDLVLAGGLERVVERGAVVAVERDQQRRVAARDPPPVAHDPPIAIVRCGGVEGDHLARPRVGRRVVERRGRRGGGRLGAQVVGDEPVFLGAPTVEPELDPGDPFLGVLDREPLPALRWPERDPVPGDHPARRVEREELADGLRPVGWELVEAVVVDRHRDGLPGFDELDAELVPVELVRAPERRGDDHGSRGGPGTDHYPGPMGSSSHTLTIAPVAPANVRRGTNRIPAGSYWSTSRVPSVVGEPSGSVSKSSVAIGVASASGPSADPTWGPTVGTPGPTRVDGSPGGATYAAPGARSPPSPNPPGPAAPRYRHEDGQHDHGEGDDARQHTNPVRYARAENIFYYK